MKNQRGDIELLMLLCIPVVFLIVGVYASRESEKDEARKSATCGALVDAWYAAKEMPQTWRETTRQSIKDCGIDLEMRP